MAWTVETLRSYLQLPQASDVIATALKLAVADVERFNTDNRHSEERIDLTVLELFKQYIGDDPIDLVQRLNTLAPLSKQVAVLDDDRIDVFPTRRHR